MKKAVIILLIIILIIIGGIIFLIDYIFINKHKLKNNETKTEEIISLDVLIYYLDEQISALEADDNDECGCGTNHCHDEKHECSGECGGNCHCHDE